MDLGHLCSKPNLQLNGNEELRFYEPNLNNGAMEFEEETLKEGSKEWESKVVSIFIYRKLPHSIVKLK